MPDNARHLPSNDPANLGLSPDRTQRLIDVLQREVDRGYIPGAVVMLARHGSVALHTALGQRDPATGTASPRFRTHRVTTPSQLPPMSSTRSASKKGRSPGR